MSAEDMRDEITGGSVRAVEVHGTDLSPLAGLDIEYLFTTTPNVDATPINSMTGLRGLSLDSWRGHLVVSRLRNLDWFGVVEVDRGQLDELFDNGHPSITWLSVGKYREQDVTPLVRLPQLTSLAIAGSRSLGALDGIGGPRQLATVDLAMCPGLGSLDGIESARALQAITLESCNKLDDLSPLADLPDLRVVQLDMRTTPSLAPLAGHPPWNMCGSSATTLPPEKSRHSSKQTQCG